MTLKELADKVGLTEATIQKYEAGNIKKIDILMLQNIANALNVNSWDIAGWKNDKINQIGPENTQGAEEAKVIKMYSRLTNGHMKAVQNLIQNLLECQEKYNSDK